MAGTALKLGYDDQELQKVVRGILKRTDNFEPVMKTWGNIGRTSVIRNFEEGGRPDKWKPSKSDNKTLMKQGFAGGLAGSINFWPSPRNVILGTNKIYGAIHQFGGETGKNHAVTIEQREYLMIQDEDLEEMQAVLTDYVIQG